MSEPIKKIEQTPESYSPKDKPEIINMAEDYTKLNGKDLPPSAKVRYSGSINQDGPILVPHTRAFASAMMSLTVFMGTPHDTRVTNDKAFRADYDYYKHLLVSGEGFLFWHDVWNYITDELPQGLGPDTWESIDNLPKNAEPLLDCFEIAGIESEFYSSCSVNGIKGGWSSEQVLKEMTMRNLAEGFPVLLFSGEPGDRIILAIGYRKDGDALLTWTFSAGGNKQNTTFSPDKCKWLSNWTENIVAVVLIKSAPQTPTDIKLIKPMLRKALARGAEFLRRDIKLEAFRDIFNNNEKPHIHPEIWDLAERRAFLSNELEEVAKIFETDQLASAVDASMKILDNMWRIDALSKSKKGREALNDATVQKQIADILSQCRQLDLMIADTISIFLTNETPEGYSPKNKPAILEMAGAVVLETNPEPQTAASTIKDEERNAVRIVELPACKMVTSGPANGEDIFAQGGILTRFNEWFTEFDKKRADRFYPRDFMWSPPSGGFQWGYAVDEIPADTGSFNVIDFPGGLYAVAISVDADGQDHNKVYSRILEWVENSGCFVLDETYERRSLGNITSPPMAKAVMGYEQMDLYFPIVVKREESK